LISRVTQLEQEVTASRQRETVLAAQVTILDRALDALNRVGGGIASSVLSHHRTCVVAYGGFIKMFTQLIVDSFQT